MRNLTCELRLLINSVNVKVLNYPLSPIMAQRTFKTSCIAEQRVFKLFAGRNLSQNAKALRSDGLARVC